MIASGFPLGAAVQYVGLANILSGLLIEVVTTPFMALVAVYLTTAFLTELITNNAAAIIMVPIALCVADK